MSRCHSRSDRRIRWRLAAFCALLTLAVGGKAGGAEWDEETFLADPVVQELLGSSDDLTILDGADDLLRELAAFRENPVDVNTASRVDLLRVPTLDPADALRIHASRTRAGPFASLDELVARGCLSSESLEAARPYIAAVRVDTVCPLAESGAASGESESSRAIIGPEAASGDETQERSLRWEITSRVVVGEPAEDSWSAGGLSGRLAGFTRIRLFYLDRMDLSATCEKDRGESDLLDHSGIALVWRNGSDAATNLPASRTPDDIRAAMGLGDFIASWGQGLVVRSGGFPAAGSFPRSSDRLKRYDGAGETTARRGAFLELRRGDGIVRAVVGRTRLDAGIDSNGLVSAVRTSGYHRTPGELAGKGALFEELLGARVSHARIAGVEIGGSVLRFSFDPALAAGDPERRHFGFAGDVLTVGSVDARLKRNDHRVGVELARSSQGGTAWLAAARLKSGRTSARLGVGYLSKDYWSPVGGGIPGFSGGTNGASAWLQVEYRSRGAWRIWSSAVVTSRPWRSYHLELPDRSWSSTAGAEMPLARVARILLETRTRNRLVEESDPPGTVTTTTRRQRAVLTLAEPVGLGLGVFRSEAAVGGAQEGSVEGVDARVTRTIGDAVSVDVGAASVAEAGDAPGLIRYEPALPGEFGLRSLNASGTRWYIRARAALGSRFSITARLGGGPEPGRVEFGMCIDAGG